MNRKGKRLYAPAKSCIAASGKSLKMISNIISESIAHNTGDVQKIASLMLQRTSCVEMRVLGAGSIQALAGYFDTPEQVVAQIEAVQGVDIGGLYISLQKFPDEIKDRAYNRVSRVAALKDQEVARYLWLPIDFDPVRPSGISSTDEEKAQALALIHKVRGFLEESQGWPSPIEADSGNGYHLLYPIDLPVSEGRELVKRVLLALDRQFSNERVKIDASLYNPARIIKLYGTVARKGEHTEERPHRASTLLEVPSSLEIVTREQLEGVAPASTTGSKSILEMMREGEKPESNFDMQAWLDRYGIATTSKIVDPDGTIRWNLKQCPFNPEDDPHGAGRGAYVILKPNGARIAGCKHTRCEVGYGNRWAELRAMYEGVKSPYLEGGESEDEETQEQALRRIADEAELYRSPEGQLFARVLEGGKRKNLTIGERNSSFARWLTYRYMLEKGGKTPRPNTLAQVMNGMAAKASFVGKESTLFVRYAQYEGKQYLDLANDEGQAVEIDATGWRVIDTPPVHFKHPNGMLPLPTPEKGGNLEMLKEVIHTSTETDFRLIVGWLLGALHPTGPYPVLVLTGEQGSAKSTTTRMLREIIDPNTALLRNPPKDDQTMAIAARNNWCLAFDNLSTISPWLSDSLCMVATGSGHATRTLYTDDEETIFSARRPQIINGIDETMVNRGDLLNRSIVVSLAPIPPTERKLEGGIQRRFEELHPRLLGALLDAVVVGLRESDTVRLPEKPRMADFATWVVATEEHLGWQKGQFFLEYTTNQENAYGIELENSFVAKAVINYCRLSGEYSGTMSDFLDVLTTQEPELANKPQWPQKPRGFSAELTRITPALRTQGIVVTKLGSKNGRPQWLVRKEAPVRDTQGNDQQTNDPITKLWEYGKERNFPYVGIGPMCLKPGRGVWASVLQEWDKGSAETLYGAIQDGSATVRSA